MGAQEQPVVLLNFQRCWGTFGQPPTADRLRVQFAPKELQLVDDDAGRAVFVLPLSRRGLPAALAALVTAEAVECRVHSVHLVEPMEEDAGSGGEERLDVLLTVALLPPCFELEEGDEAGPALAVLVAHWEELQGELAEAAASGDEDSRRAQHGSTACGPFAAQLQAGWWQAHSSSAEAAAADGGASSEAAAGAGNPRDRIFHLVLPSDWRLEAPEPPGLCCTLFRYQRRCLAWLKWRESLGGGCHGSSGPGTGAGAGVPADPGSRKVALPSTDLSWQPLSLPSGLRGWYDPVRGCLRSAPVTPALPEVPGGLLCDEMGLGKTVEMMALFLANPPPQGLRAQALQHQPSSQAVDAVAERGGSPEQQSAGSSGMDGGAAGTGGGGDRSPQANRGGGGQRSNGHISTSVPRAGTLVVCPPALLQQWQSELANHAHGALVVEVYDGLRGLERAAEAENGGRGKRLKPAQREMELFNRLLQGEEAEAGFDAAAEAAAAARRLQEADVVLTSFDVLRAEVYFVPSARSFRRPKKYTVPHCPLLQLHWWRLVIDEAQMVGPLSAAGTMAERMKAVHRWCVTGTPMGAHKNELTDIHALLSTLQHRPFADAATWRRLAAEPIAAGGGAAARQAWSLLETVLAPLMWRNTKGVVAQEFHLPPRSLHPVWLAFQPGERAFYEQVVEKMREARQQLEEFRQRQEAGSDEDEEYGGSSKRSTPAALRTRKRRQAKQGERLESAAVDNISQLRLACIHPQLTRMWRDMQAEAQLGIGATLSMEEIMQRLVESAQNDLQEAERNLCAHLNTLAMRLLAKADAASVGGGSSQARLLQAGDAAVADELAPAPLAGLGEGEPGSPPPAKRPRKSKGGFDGLGREALRAQALLCLEQSFRVAEKGIAAMDVGMDQLEGMPDIEAASTSTVNAWKRLQINTATQLGKLHAAAGRAEEARRMDLDAQDKVSYLRSQAEMEHTSAQQRLEQVQKAAEEARRAFRLHFTEAAERGFGRWGITSDASRWLSGLEAAYWEARELEERELEAQEGKIKALLGRRVQAALDDVEKQLHGELTQLDRYVGEQHAAAGCRQLVREQHSWERAQVAAGGADGGGSASGGVSAAEAAVVARGVRVLWELLKLLPDFRRKTLLAQHVVVFSKLMAEEGEKKAAEAARRKAEAEAQRAAAGVEPEVVQVEENGLPTAAAGSQQQQQPRDSSVSTQQQSAGTHPDAQHQGSGSQERQVAAATASAPQELAAVLAAVDARQEFAPASGWLGRIKGYVFKLGKKGLGYHRDAPPVVEATLAQLHIVAAAVGRALQEHQRRLSKAAGPEAQLFAALSLDAVEAKLESVKQQIQLTRALKEQHVAERTLALKAALQADLDADLQAAAQLPPLPSGGSADKLTREVERLREEALSLLHRKRYMASRVSEARQLQPAAGPGGGAVPAQQQQQQQQQEQDGGHDQAQRAAGQQQAEAAQQQEQQQRRPAGWEQQTQHEQQVPLQANGQAGQQQAAGPSAAPVGPAGAAAAGAADAGDPGPAGLQGGQDAGPSGSGTDGVAHGAHHAGGVECPVCLCIVPAGHDIHVFSACGHAFCKDCAAKLVVLQGMCAVCRQKVSPTQVCRVAAGGARSASASDPEFEALGKIQPQGEWSAKVEALLRRLVHLQTTAPAEKALIFSQFPEALKLVALALQTNGIRFVQLLGGRAAARKAVASFRDDEEVRVFLLSHRAGAAGLTLVRASRVFLLEPALDPSIEQQAVARVHRIGQQRPVVVTRLLVQDSIEARVLAVQEAKHSLFSGADGGAEDTAELATTVEAPVRPETLGEEDLRGLLEGM